MSDPGAGDGPQATAGDQAPLAIDEWPYLQVADRLEDRIRRGEFGAGGKLPDTGDLADWYGVSAGVVRHSRQELVRRNLAVFRLGHGYFAPIAQAHPQAAD